MSEKFNFYWVCRSTKQKDYDQALKGRKNLISTGFVDCKISEYGTGTFYGRKNLISTGFVDAKADENIKTIIVGKV